jgi:hypothetical protein
MFSSLEVLSLFLFSVAGGGVAERGGVATGGVLNEFAAFARWISELIEPRRSSLGPMVAGCWRKEDIQSKIGWRLRNTVPRLQHLTARCRELRINPDYRFCCSFGVCNAIRSLRIVSSSIGVDSSCPATCYRFLNSTISLEFSSTRLRNDQTIPSMNNSKSST